ncbi:MULTISPECIES: flagellar motor protein MotB [Campylobacter]|uniref:Flagellar motor protein n=1 Tax=Campylobacter porcelli TaxID=1660073 RepID=A0A1X9SYB7_9BACT|nr:MULTISPECIES: flagellar motor protein MotB [unclassified Campylobacter]MCR8679149.1 flagellar motor protein MotB [Campylobacter sp. RM19072]MCR8696025.1 flagellar motor protein MotB [Campylobacter sp. RM19073]MEE3704720.1 flagellar motor protein MotB [Campylobacter sp. CX2-8023-23]MEE3744693.1 flagellar motor protein MotB [Campylobacter sp. CX2-4855-23]MEE3776418.1 flagellar motor protein MotB [Campylobacter sp. CX2-4080-23]
MAKKKKCPECPAGEKWAVPYADFLSLLLALFIALYAISAVNKAKVEALKTEFIKIFEFPDTKSLKESSKTSNSSKEFDSPSIAVQAQNQTSVNVNLNNERYKVTLDQAENQVAIDLPASIKFDYQSSKIYNPDMINFINIVAMIINKIPESVVVDIRGYADDFGDYETDYRLGIERAYSVFTMLANGGVESKRMRITSFGDSVNIINSDLKIAKIYFKIDVKDKALQKSVLDILSELK